MKALAGLGGARPPAAGPGKGGGNGVGRPKPRPKPPARRGLRLVEAVALAAGGLLVLKLIALTTDERPAEIPFAQVQPRAGYEVPDPVTTGATTPKEAPKETAKEASKEAGKEEKAAPTAPEAAPKPALPAGGSPSERALLERLGERRDQLQARNRDLDVRERLLENAEKRLDGKLGELKATEERLDGGASKRGETETAALKNLVTMYETMKPKDAARVFDRLALDVLVPVVLGMNPRKMAEVLALMAPEAAEKLTVALATRARGLGETKTATALPPGELPAIEPAR